MRRSDEEIQKFLDEEVEPVYVELSSKIGEADSPIMPHVFKRLADLEQANILNMIESPIEEIAEKLSLDKEAVEKQIQVMFEKGIVMPGRSGWHLSRSWGSLHDNAASSNPKYDNDEFFDLAFVKSEETHQKNRIDPVLRGERSEVRQIMRVVPRWRSIKDIPGVMPCEDIREIFKDADPIVLVNCACKKIDRSRECQDTIPTETCVTNRRSGQYNLNRGAGRQLSYDELLALFDELDKYPLVHLTGNTNSMSPLICNCHSCCCGIFQSSAKTKAQLNQLTLAKSRFIAAVDPEKCRGCKVCVSRCPIGAAQMKHYSEYDGERAYIDAEECIGCGLCVLTCPAEAREMKLVRPPEHIPAPAGLPYATG